MRKDSTKKSLPNQPVIRSIHTEPERPIAGFPFKLVIEGELGENPWCEVIDKELLRQDLPEPLSPPPFDIEGRRLWEAQYTKRREAIYGPCYLLEHSPSRIVWQGILKEPGVYVVGVKYNHPTLGILYSQKTVEFKLGWPEEKAIETPAPQERQVKVGIRIRDFVIDLVSSIIKKILEDVVKRP